MGSWSTRFAAQKFERFFDEADQIATQRAPVLYQEAAERAAEWWSGRILASGRAPGHGMENIQGRATQPRAGGFFFRVGWLSGAPKAVDGKTSWFVYQDAGYDPFGMIRKGYAATPVPGLLLQIDARRMLQEGVRDANEQIAREIKRAARRLR